ncbi:MAG: hypothetical protein JWR69_1662 [Pedosphaera sp.]|nr:hypothetical protein [Pedosphaera sp.]
MNERKPLAWSDFQLLTLALGLLGCIALFHLGSAAAGKSYYRDIHLGTALEFARTRIDIFHPIIVGFNATQTPTPQELPLWQAAAALGFKVLGPWFGWANLISLLLFSTCLFPLYQLAKAYGGTRCACWTLVFFLAEPLVFLHAGLASTDGFSLASTIWFLFAAVRLLQTSRPIWWLLACATGTVAIVSKLPFFMAAGLTIFLLTVCSYRTSLRAWLLMGSIAAFTGVVFFAWTGYANRCLALAEFPYVDLRASSSNMVFWYFGDLHFRLSPGPWVKGAWRMLNACFGSMALAGLSVVSLLFLQKNTFAKLWLAGAVLTTLVFTHLVLHHWHYFLMFTPAIALLCASTAVAWEKSLACDSRGKSHLAMGVVALALLLSLAQGLVGMKIVLFQDPFEKKMVEIIKTHSSEADKMLIAGGSWGGEELFLGHRQGLSIWNTQLLEDPAHRLRLKELGYNKLVMISQSPLLVAAQAVNPGEGGAPRKSYREFMTPAVTNWPTLYENEDILIKEIP